MNSNDFAIKLFRAREDLRPDPREDALGAELRRQTTWAFGRDMAQARVRADAVSARLCRQMMSPAVTVGDTILVDPAVLPPDAPGKEAYVEYLHERYGTFDNYTRRRGEAARRRDHRGQPRRLLSRSGRARSSSRAQRSRGAEHRRGRAGREHRRVVGASVAVGDRQHLGYRHRVALAEPSETRRLGRRHHAAIAIVQQPHYVRLTRAAVMGEMNKDYVTAARVIGVRRFRLMFVTILPNCMAPLIVQAALSFSTAILDAAALGFLGMGAQPPTPEWGTMLAEAREFILRAWWVVTLPGCAILLTVLAINLMGDGLRDALDPKLKRS